MGQRHLPHAAIISPIPKLPVIAVLEKYVQRFPNLFPQIQARQCALARLLRFLPLPAFEGKWEWRAALLPGSMVPGAAMEGLSLPGNAFSG
jgi:hypothetical protein